MLEQWQVQDAIGNPIGSVYGYDASGRLTSDTEETDRAALPGEPPGKPNGSGNILSDIIYVTGTRSKTYDAENRIRTQQSSFDYLAPVPTSYGGSKIGGYWSDNKPQPYDLAPVDYTADGHPARLALSTFPGTSAAYSVTLDWLWDGNDRFFELSELGTNVLYAWFSLDGLADYSPQTGAILVYDRDLSGEVVVRHSSLGFSNFAAGLKIPNAIASEGIQSVTAPSSESPVGSDLTAAFGVKSTADGWTLGNNTWQGVRTFDFGIGQWNTPDAYAGNVHDPMSQLP